MSELGQTDSPFKEQGDRLLELLNELNLSQYDLADKIGLKTASAVNHWTKGRNDISREYLNKISEATGVNIDWLKTGRGRMFSPGRETSTKLVNIPGQRPQQYRHGAGLFKYPSQNYLKILPIVVDNNNNELCAVVPLKAQAGYREGFEDIYFISQLPVETTPADLVGKGTIRKFEVDGDSMEPEIKKGDFVYCSYVEFYNENDLKQVLLNKYVYVVNTLDGLFIKRVEYRAGDLGLRLLSDNKTSPPAYVPFDRIKELWVFRRKYSGQVPAPEEATERLEMKTLRERQDEMNKRIDKLMVLVEEGVTFMRALQKKDKQARK